MNVTPTLTLTLTLTWTLTLGTGDQDELAEMQSQFDAEKARSGGGAR